MRELGQERKRQRQSGERRGYGREQSRSLS